jgi:branched-subunit amino acid aminotransferase/4-amino-4-deoxychorismate lyase
MHKYAAFNCQIVSAENIFINAISQSVFYGKGIFTTVAIYNSKPFLWGKHWFRLIENAEKIGVDLSEFSEQKIKDSLFEIIAENKITNGRARLTFFDESSIPIWQTEQKRKTNFLINTADVREIPEHFRLTISPFRTNSTSPLANIKSCNYLENILALEDTKAKGFDEAIRLNERDEIASACMANVFWSKEGEIFTPDLETGCLAGTTREFILENYPVIKIKADLNELNKANAIFLTSAGIGIVQAAEFQQKEFSLEFHELTEILKGQMNSI